MKVIFAVSMGLNLLFVGILGGGVVRHMLHMPPPLPPEIRSLSPENQDLVSDSLHNVRMMNYELGKQINTQRKLIATHMGAERFDQDIFQQAIDRLKELRSEQTQNLADAAKIIAVGFSQEDRKVLAQLLRRPPPEDRGLSKESLPHKPPLR